jgi:putative endonuclease
VLYIGFTNNIKRRIYEHKHKIVEGFSSKYNLSKLVYFETFEDSLLAITREKELKKWRREKKDELISTKNPEWKDLSAEFES